MLVKFILPILLIDLKSFKILKCTVASTYFQWSYYYIYSNYLLKYDLFYFQKIIYHNTKGISMVSRFIIYTKLLKHVNNSKKWLL